MAIVKRDDNRTHAAARGLLMLFAQGQRPGVDELCALLAGQEALGITAELAEEPSIGVELASRGLTLELLGLAGGAAVPGPVWRNLVACDHDEASATFEAVELRLGSHIAAGSGMLPVTRQWLACGAILGDLLPHCACYVWQPASLAVGTRFFRESLRRWADKGAFPAHALIAFNHSLDGAIHSSGLAFFTGQELRLEPPLSQPGERGERIAATLAGHLALGAQLIEPTAVTGPDNTQIRLEPSANGRFVRAWQG